MTLVDRVRDVCASKMASDQRITLSYLKEKVDEFVKAREWTKYHKPKDLAISVVLESSELLEPF